MGIQIETEENEVKKGKKKKKLHIGRTILLIIIIACVIVGIIFAKKLSDLEGNWMAVLLGHDKETIENLETLRILIMGESTGMSDTIIVCSYNPRTQNVSMLSIPRDTYVLNGNYKYSGYNKINSLYSSFSDNFNNLRKKSNSCEKNNCNTNYYFHPC